MVPAREKETTGVRMHVALPPMFVDHAFVHVLRAGRVCQALNEQPGIPPFKEHWREFACWIAAVSGRLARLAAGLAATAAAPVAPAGQRSRSVRLRTSAPARMTGCTHQRNTCKITCVQLKGTRSMENLGKNI